MLVVCTHGGTSWGLISSFDPDFGYEQYKEVGSPDINRFVYEGDRGIYDAEFRIEILCSRAGAVEWSSRAAIYSREIYHERNARGEQKGLGCSITEVAERD